MRAPTPTAAAELAAPSTRACLELLAGYVALLRRRMHDVQDGHAQGLDRSALRLARPADSVRRHGQRLGLLAHRLGTAAQRGLEARQARCHLLDARWNRAASAALAAQAQRLAGLQARLAALDPQRVLQRGYAWLSDDSGSAVLSVAQLSVGTPLRAHLRDGSAGLSVTHVDPPAPG